MHSVDWPPDRRLQPELRAPRSPEEAQEGLVCDFLAVPQEKLAELRARLTSFEFRDLTLSEIVDWMVDSSREDAEHKFHALKFIEDATSVHPVSAFRKPLEELARDENPEISRKARELLQ